MISPPNPHGDGSQPFRLKSFRHPRPAVPDGVVLAETLQPIVQIATRSRTLMSHSWEAADQVANDPIPPAASITLDVQNRITLHDVCVSTGVDQTTLANALISRGLNQLIRQLADRLHPTLPPAPAHQPRAFALNYKPTIPPDAGH